MKDDFMKYHALAEECTKLYNGITNIDDKYIEEAQQQRSGTAAKGKVRTLSWFSFKHAATLILSLLVLGSATAVVASPALRSAIIRFLQGGKTEKVPFELLIPTETPETPAQGTASQGNTSQGMSSEGTVPVKADVPVTLGSITFLQTQSSDAHFAAAYISSSDHLSALHTPSGRLLFRTWEPESESTVYYRLADGILELLTPEQHDLEGSVQLGNMPGVMSYDGSTEYASIILPQMTFRVDWQQLGDDILILDTEAQFRFDIGSTFGGTKDGASIEGRYDGGFSAAALKGDSEWVSVFFHFDSQLTGYAYPFLFNLHTGEIADPLAEVDLSAYPCITDLRICDDKKTAAAMAGTSHEDLKEILIDLDSGAVIEQEELSPDPPVSSCHFSMTTGDHTVFYTLGDNTCVDGYLYDTDTRTSKTLFQGAAWGYIWDHGFADTYVRLIGGNYAAYYKEPENQVYLMNLADGEMYLLEGIPASHDVSFFWNDDGTLLSISVNDAAFTSRLAFYTPGAEIAWYFDRERRDDIRETSSGWYGEYGYLISAASEDDQSHYLYLYEYIP